MSSAGVVNVGPLATNTLHTVNGSADFKQAAGVESKIRFYPNNQTSYYAIVGSAGASNNIITGSVAGDFCIRAIGTKKILFSTDDAGGVIQGELSAGAWTLGHPGFAGTHIFRCVRTQQIDNIGNTLENGMFSWTNVTNGSTVANFGVPDHFRGFLTVSQWNSINGNQQTTTLYFVTRLGTNAATFTQIATNSGNGGSTSWTLASSTTSGIQIVNTSGYNCSGNVVWSLAAGA